MYPQPVPADTNIGETLPDVPMMPFKTTTPSEEPTINHRKRVPPMEKQIDESSTERELHVAVDLLIEDIYDGRTVWTNSWCKDFWIHLANSHLILGLFFSNQYHPIEKGSRMALLFINILLSSYVAALVFSVAITTQSIEDAREDDVSVYIMEAIRYTFNFILTLIATMIMYVFKKAAQCRCKRNSQHPRCCTHLGVCVLISGIITGAILPLFVIFAIANHQVPLTFASYFEQLLWSQFNSYFLIGIFISAVLFWWSHYREKRKFRKSGLDDIWIFWREKHPKIDAKLLDHDQMEISMV